jgi:DNA/RNA endonuclease YhcR with UshA esterase domain
VARDASGNFAAGTITAALSGNATSATNVAGGAANRIVFNTNTGTTSFVVAPTASGQVLNWNGSAFTYVAGTISGITLGSNLNALTAGTYLTSAGTYDGSTARTFAVDATTTNTASKVVARDASGNFSAGTITAALSGNATTATSAATWTTARTLTIGATGKSVNGSADVSWTVPEVVGFTPVQQGGGTGQGSNKLYMGWTGSALALQVDSTNFGSTWPIGVTGNAATATTATNVSGTVAVANGGTGTTSLTANNVLLGNGTSALQVVAPGTTGNVLTSNGTTWTSAAGLSLSGDNTWTGTQTFSGTSSKLAMVLNDAAEVATISAIAATGTINFDVTTQSVLYYTTNASGNWTLNVRASSGTTLNTVMATGQSVTIAFIVTNGATAFRQTGFQVDGSSVTPRWQGGTAPAAGNASSLDAYVITIIKTGAATFTALASQTRFA